MDLWEKSLIMWAKPLFIHNTFCENMSTCVFVLLVKGENILMKYVSLHV